MEIKMKRNLFFALLAAILFSSCSSLSTIKDPAAVSPLAVITVYSNSEIGWYREEKSNSGLLDNFLSKTINKAKNETVSTLLSRADILVNDAEKSLLTAFSTAPVKLVEKESIVESSVYVSKSESQLENEGEFIKADGYKILTHNDASFAAQLSKETGANGLVYVNFTFSKLVLTGIEKNGTLGAGVRMNITITDKAGKMLFAKSFYEQSKKSTAVVAGVYNPQALLDLFPPVIDKVCQDFAAEF